MKAAMLVPRVTADPAANLDRVEQMAADAAGSGARLVLLPEAVLTGLINNDDPAHDLPLGQSIPGPATDRLGAVARLHSLWVGFGLFERDGDCLYDSAVLIAPDGSVALKYRRNQPQWHDTAADSAIYRQGTSIEIARTPFGSVGFLICGDLFDDALVARFRALRPDLLLFPFARCFTDGSADQARWDAEEMPEYACQIVSVGAPALMTNYIGDSDIEECPSFGGAFAVSADGEAVASLPLGVEGALLVDLDKLL
ncbi:MAG TPA: carbon-nitrogen hydrolase family protein [Firmicutes bacterium]|nr:carbon-nitrogen hydrolase family protein [Bacillota bacterium]